MKSIACGLERDPRAQLELTSRRGCLSDRAELWCIHEPVWSTEIRVIEGVERLATEFKSEGFAQGKRAHHGEIKSSHAGSVDGVASNIAKRERRWSAEGGWVKPLTRVLCPGTED